ncbi:translation initiation factor IF-2 [Thermanaerovibrio acidaminovorans]|jgi:translation initiation factor IF-2|uniref:translation initiation factor IF-2 n=1 Tax=Thermanaerovibrio acidaminovorans TaxID=81462 RepID=UPI002413D5F6|nr:translation initiation factor IF-2 [Thermanaerovibrio acidaminovorans]
MGLSKIRVYELAKMLGKSNGELMEVLKDLGVEVKTHMSSIDADVAQMVEDAVRGSSNGVAETGLKRVPYRTGCSVGDVAKALGQTPGGVVKVLVEAGLMAPASAPADDKILSILSRHFGVEFVAEEAPAEGVPSRGDGQDGRDKQPKAVKAKGKKDKGAKRESTGPVSRPPIVTVMGHVDHGKTTLLDFIRKTRVADKEAGGITQHIGASVVDYEGRRIVFLDTPGHEAFTAMRARGAKVTDIAILVVAADDGVMPQTLEALNHAKAAGVPIIVAINKVDKPEARPDRVRQQLSDHGLVPEEWGGDTVMVEVAAKSGLGVDQLLEMVLLVADMEELKADPSAEPRGTVVEANLDKGKGPVATVIVQDGTLRRGHVIRTASTWGKIRAMLDHRGKFVDEAGPSTPVEILGFESVPQPGEVFERVADEREARELHERQLQDRRGFDQRRESRFTLEELYERMQQGSALPQLNLVLKCDVQGSVEAFRSSIMKMSSDEVGINIVHEGVGRISESDVMLASASNAIIIGFNVRPDANAKKLAEAEGVQIRLYNIIYDVLDDVKAALEGMLAPTIRESTLGQAEIRAVFKVPKVGKIAGCYVQEGLIRRNAKVRLIRDGVVIWEGALSTLKRFKDDVREVSAGYECGLSFQNFQDFKEGDLVEAYELVKEKRHLD